MVANEELANGELDKQLDSTKVKKVPEEPPVKKVSEDGEDYGAEKQQQRDLAKEVNE